MSDATPIVFVVDDDDAVRDSLRDLLDSVGLKVATYASALAFLTAHKAAQRGCIVLDIRMPGMSGLELQERLNRSGSTLPIVFITGHGDVPMAVEAMKRGAVDFIQKPFRDQELLDRINLALEQNRQRRDADETRHDIARRLATLTRREREVMGHGHTRQGQQGDCHRPGAQSADRRGAPFPRNGQDEGPDSGGSRQDEHQAGTVRTAPAKALMEESGHDAPPWLGQGSEMHGTKPSVLSTRLSRGSPLTVPAVVLDKDLREGVLVSVEISRHVR